MKVQFELTFDDHIAFMRYQYDHVPEMKKQITSMSRMLMIVGPVLSLILYLITRDLYGCLFTAIIVVIAGIFYPTLSKRGIKNQVMSNPLIRDTLGPVEYEISQDGLVYRTHRAETKTQWEGILKIETTDDYLFVYTDPKLAHAIPAKRLTSGDYDAFVQCLKEKVQSPKKEAI